MGNVNISGMRMGSTAARASSQPAARQQQQTPPKSSGGSGEWDDRAVRKLVAEGKLASRVKGSDRSTDCKGTEGDCVECPICFLYFDSFNVSKCCRQPICTECYLQIKPPQKSTVACPFCSVDRFGVAVAVASPSDDERAEAKDGERRRTKSRDCFEETDESKEVNGAQPKQHDELMKQKVMSVEERLELEEQMRKQLVLARERGDSVGSSDDADVGATRRHRGRSSSSSSRYYAATGGRGAAAAAANNNNNRGAAGGSLEEFHSLLSSLGASNVGVDLQHVEELMVLEAMRASLHDDEANARRRREQLEEAGGGTTEAAAPAAADAEEDELAAAILASMSEPQPPQEAAPAPSSSAAPVPAATTEEEAEPPQEAPVLLLDDQATTLVLEATPPSPITEL